MFNVFQSLQGRLISLITLVALPGFIFLWVEAKEDRHQALEAAEYQAVKTLFTLKEHQIGLISRTERYLKRLSGFTQTHYPNSAQCSAFLRHALLLSDTYYNLGVPGPDGELNCNALPLNSRVNVADRAYIQTAIKTRAFAIGKYQIDRAAGLASVNFAYPVIDPQNEDLLGIAVAVVSLDWWSHRLAEIDLPRNSIAYITDSSEKIIAIHPKVEGLIGNNAKSIYLSDESQEIHNDYEVSITTDEAGITRLFAHSHLLGNKPSPLTFNIGIPIGEKLIQIEKKYFRDGLILLSSFLILLTFSVWFARTSILNPIKQLAERIQNSDGSGSEPQRNGIKELLQLNTMFTENNNKRLAAERRLLQEKERFELAMKGANDGLYDWNLKENTIYYSPRWKSMLGYDDNELPNDFSTWEELVKKEDREKSWEMLTDYINRKRDDFNLEFQMKHKNGQWIDILSRAFLIRDEEGEAIRIVGTHVDISEKNRQKAKLISSEQRFRDIALNSADWIWEIDKDGYYTFVSDSVYPLLGYQPDEIIGKTPFDLMTPDEAIRVTRDFKKITDSKASFKELENIIIDKDGRAHITLTNGTPILDIEGNLQGYRGVDRDITRKRAMEDLIRDQAYHDDLTKLPNRRLFFDRLNQSVASSKRSGFHGALLFLDLDNFKPINDIHGHDAGDLLLIEVSNRLNRCVREVDTVARFGGDEFVVLLDSLDTDKTKSVNQAIKVAEKIAEEINRPYKLEKKNGDNTHFIEHHCSVSIGVALFLDSGSPDEIVNWADTAMYEAKNNTKNTVHLFNRDKAD